MLASVRSKETTYEKTALVLGLGLLIGCDYTVPLVTTPETEIDSSVLGLWQSSTENGQTEQLLVLPLDKHEYLVSYPSGAKDAMFARASLCPVANDREPLAHGRFQGIARHGFSVLRFLAGCC